MKYKAADAPITFKEIVMVMINLGSTISEEKLVSDKSFVLENAGIFDERALDGSLCLNYSGDLQKSSEISKIFSYIQVSNKNISYSIKIKSNAMCSEKNKVGR